MVPGPSGQDLRAKGDTPWWVTALRALIVVVLVAAGVAVTAPGATASTQAKSTTVVLLAYHGNAIPQRGRVRHEKVCKPASAAAYENIYIHAITCETVVYIPNARGDGIEYVDVGVYLHDTALWGFWVLRIGHSGYKPVISSPKYYKVTGGATGSTYWIRARVPFGRTLPKHTGFCLTFYKAVSLHPLKGVVQRYVCHAPSA